MTDSRDIERNTADIDSSDLTSDRAEVQIPVPNGAEDAAQEADQDAALYCANHPGTETLLRCNRCEKPICLKCAKLTDVGYRCNECLRNVQDKYFNAESKDNPVAFGIAFIITFIATPIAGIFTGLFGFFGFFIAIMLGSAAGGALAQIVRRTVGKRRGRNLRYFALGGIILGFIFSAIVSILLLGIFPGGLALLLFVGLAASTAVAILR